MKTFIEVIKCASPFIAVFIIILFTPVFLIKADALSTGYLNESLINWSALYMFVLSFLYSLIIAKSNPEEF